MGGHPLYGSWFYTNCASSVILVLPSKSFEIGQPALAFAAAVSKAALSAPGTLALVVRWIAVMPKPPSTFSSLTAAVVSRDSGTRLAPLRWALSAMEKQPA